MLHILLLAVFTTGVATLTFALMGLASMLSVACRSSADGRFRVLRPGLFPSAASDGMPRLSGSGTFPAARRGNRPDRSESPVSPEFMAPPERPR
jgi:hypothetical protein